MRAYYVFHSCLRICHAGQGRIDAVKIAKHPKRMASGVQTSQTLPKHLHHTRLAVQAGHSAAVRSDVKEEAAGRGTVAQHSSAVARLHRKAAVYERQDPAR